MTQEQLDYIEKKIENLGAMPLDDIRRQILQQNWFWALNEKQRFAVVLILISKIRFPR